MGAGGLLFFHFGLAGFGMGILGGELLAQFVMARYFVTHDLARQGVALPLRSLAPITLSTVSVLVFLLSDGGGFTVARYVYPVALLGVAIAAWWGWNSLDHNVKMRLSGLVATRFK